MFYPIKLMLFYQLISLVEWYFNLTSWKFSIESGMWNLECVVRLFGNNNDAIPDDVIANIISLFDLIC